MSEDDEKTRVVRGHVKWFDPVKGFGFIISGETKVDVLLHANVLRNYGQNSVADGSEICVEVQDTRRGAQAISVVSLEPPQSVSYGLSEEAELLASIEVEELVLEPARVKWFDRSKGFGFGNVFGRDEDVFIHVEVLRVSGLADLQAGEAVCLKIVDGSRGRMAVRVLSWDSALRNKKP